MLLSNTVQQSMCVNCRYLHFSNNNACQDIDHNHIHPGLIYYSLWQRLLARWRPVLWRCRLQRMTAAARHWRGTIQRLEWNSSGCRGTSIGGISLHGCTRHESVLPSNVRRSLTVTVTVILIQLQLARDPTIIARHRAAIKKTKGTTDSYSMSRTSY